MSRGAVGLGAGLAGVERAGGLGGGDAGGRVGFAVPEGTGQHAGAGSDGDAADGAGGEGDGEAAPEGAAEAGVSGGAVGARSAPGGEGFGGGVVAGACAAVRGLPEGGDGGLFAGEFGGAGRLAAERGGGLQELFKFACAVPVPGTDLFTAQQSLGGVLVEPVVPVVGHHMSFCVRAAVSVTPGTYDSATPSRRLLPCTGTPLTVPPPRRRPAAGGPEEAPSCWSAPSLPPS